MRTLRRVARYLKDAVGLPFKAVGDVEETPGRTNERVPTSSPTRLIWAVKSDYSLDPVAAPSDLHPVGVEIITPPLPPHQAAKTVEFLVERMLEDGDFLPALGAGST